MRERKNDYIYLEYLRVISAFAVIVVHVSGANWYHLDIGDWNWCVQTMFNLAGRYSVCVFCMISGALLLRPDKEVPIHDVFSRRIKRVVMCCAAWTVFYAAFYTGMNQGDLHYFILHLVQLPKHLWYLLMLMGLYLATPVLRRITADRTLTLYLIRLLIVFGALFGTVSGLTGFFKEMAGDSFGYSLWTAFLGDLEEMNRTFLPGYLGLFLLGNYLHEYGLGKWHKTVVLAAIPALLLSGILTIVFSSVTHRYVYTLMLESNPLVVLASAGIFAWFRGSGDKAGEREPHPGLAKAAAWIGSNTFGVYLVHLAVLDLLERGLGLSVESYPALLSVPLNSLLVFGISLSVAALLRQIPGVRRVVI